MADAGKPRDLGSLRIDSPAQRPGLRRNLPLVEILIVACLILAAWLLMGDRISAMVLNPQDQAQPAAAEESQPEDTQGALPPARPGEIVAGGYIEIIPPGATIVSSDVDARITAIHAVPGEQVAAGELVASLDSSQLELELSSLRSDRQVAQRELELARAGSRNEDIEAARAAVSSAEAELLLAEEEAQRAVELHEKGVISLAEKRTFETRRDTARQTLSAARSRLARLEAGTRGEEISIAEARVSQLDSRISEIRWKIAACSIESPVDGVVLEQLSEVGDWVGVAKDDGHAAAILSVYDPSQIQAWADINQRDSGLLSVGQPVTLTTDAQPDRPVKGTLSAIMPLASIQKNTVQIKVSIPDVPQDFRPGLGVRVAIATNGEEAGGEAGQDTDVEADSSEQNEGDD